jgi:hypothetical protein
MLVQVPAAIFRLQCQAIEESTVFTPYLPMHSWDEKLLAIHVDKCPNDTQGDRITE